MDEQPSHPSKISREFYRTGFDDGAPTTDRRHLTFVLVNKFFEILTARDFSNLGKFLFAGLILMLLAGVANMFFQIPALSLALSALGVMIFSAYVLYDINNIVKGGETNYVSATLNVYLDIYNIFINLLNLIMAFTGERD